MTTISKLCLRFVGFLFGLLTVGVVAQTTPTVQVKLISDLVALSIPVTNNRFSALVTGRVSTNDGAGGLFFYQASDVTTTNLGTVFKPASTTGRWLRQYSGVLNTKWFGTVGDGVADDASAIQAAINLAGSTKDKVLIPAGNYGLGAALNLTNGVTVSGTSRDSTKLLPLTSGRAVLSAAGDRGNWEVSDLSISYTTATGGVASANTNDIAILITTDGGGNYPHHFDIERIDIQYPYRLFQDGTLAYSYILDHVIGRDVGDTGFFKQRASTSGGIASFRDCGVTTFGSNGFGFLNATAISLIDCYADAGQIALSLNFCDAFVSGFVFEANTSSTDNTIINVEGGRVFMQGNKSFANVIANGGSTASEYRFHNTTQATMVGCNSVSPTYTGAGTSYTVLIKTDATKVTLDGNTIPAPTGAGGTPIAVSNNKNYFDFSAWTETAPNVTIHTNLTLSALTASKGLFTDASKIVTTTGTLSVGQGGSGAPTLSGILYGNGGSAFTAGNGTAGTISKFSAASPGLSDSHVTDDGTTIIAVTASGASGDTALALNQTSITNFCLNPSAEINTTSWSATRAAVIVDATQSKHGVNSFRVTGDGTSFSYISMNCGALGAGTYTLSVWIKSLVANPAVGIHLDSGGGGGNDSIFEMTGTEGWIRKSLTVALSAGTVTISLYSNFSGDLTALATYFDAVQLEIGPTATPYADGSLGPGYTWTGTAQNSTSIRTAGAEFYYNTINNEKGIGTAGNVSIQLAGKGVQIKEGANARMGTSILNGASPGTVTVANTSVTASTRIFLTTQTAGGSVGFPYVSAITASTSFSITSSANGDTNIVAWLLIEPSP
jgi:hypothetical protein